MSIQAGVLKQTGENDFQGSVQFLSFQGPIELRPCTSDRDNAPEMTVYSRGIEIGSARRRVGKVSQKEHVSIAFKHPQVTGGLDVLYANLGVMHGQDEDDVFAVILN